MFAAGWSEVNNSRALVVQPASMQAAMAVNVSAAGAGSVTSRNMVAQRSTTPTVITASRISPVSWSLYVNGIVVAAEYPLQLGYGPGETVQMGAAVGSLPPFEGCVHEYIVHAAPLDQYSAFALSSYLSIKWGGVATSAAARSSSYPPPPPSLAIAGAAVPLDAKQWLQTVGGAGSVVPGNSTNATECIAGVGEIDYASALNSSSTQLYSLSFRVGYSGGN